MAPLWVALTLAFPKPVVMVTGETRCPSRQDVAARVATLLSTEIVRQEPDFAELQEVGSQMVVTLVGRDGTRIGRRSLPLWYSCADLASAVGVVIATWESDVHPEFKLDAGVARLALPKAFEPGHAAPSSLAPQPHVGRQAPTTFLPTAPSSSASTSLLPAMTRTVPNPPPVLASPPAPGVAIASLPASLPISAPAPSPSPTPASGQQPTIPAGSAPPAPTIQARSTLASRDDILRPPSSSVELGAAIMGALAPGGEAANLGAAFGGMITGSWTPVRGGASGLGGSAGWGAQASLRGTAERTTDVSPGTANWRRFGLGLGPQYRWGIANTGWELDLHAEALAALLTIRGAGFASNASDRAFDLGVGGGVRLGKGVGSWRPWVELAGAGWLFAQQVYQRPADSSVSLPRLEIMLALGVSYWMGP